MAVAHDPDTGLHSAAAIESRRERGIKMYELVFGEQAPVDVWGSVRHELMPELRPGASTGPVARASAGAAAASWPTGGG